MSYKIYHTEGFILGSRSYGEANKIFKILTPDLGLVNCLAQGIRLEKSKLRFNATVRRFVKVSLVRGREHWRLIHLGLGSNLGLNLPEDKLEIFLTKTAALLLRFIHGEVGDPNLYYILKGSVLAWSQNEKNNFQNQQNLEILTMVRLLSALGYRPDDKGVEFFAQTNDWQENILSDFNVYLSRAVRSVNAILKNSHL